MSGRGRKDVTSSPTVGTSQRPASTMSAMWTRAAPEERNDSRGGRLARANGDRLGRQSCRHDTTASLRKRRICQIITGMIRTSITTATAAP